MAAPDRTPGSSHLYCCRNTLQTEFEPEGEEGEGEKSELQDSCVFGAGIWNYGNCPTLLIITHLLHMVHSDMWELEL